MNGLAITKFVANSTVILDAVLYALHGFWLIGLGCAIAAALIYIYIETE